MVTDYFI